MSARRFSLDPILVLILSLVLVPVLVLPVAVDAVARSIVEPLTQTRRVTVFSVATTPDTFATDNAQLDAPDFSLFEESVEITLAIPGSLGHAVAEQRSEILDDWIDTAGGFHSTASSEPPGTFTEAFGQSLFNLTFAVHEPVQLFLSGETNATGDGAVNLILSGPGGNVVEFRNLGDGSVPVNESAVLDPGTYQIGLNVGGFALAPGGTGPAADGSFDLQMTFPGAAGMSAPDRSPATLLRAYPNPTFGSVAFEFGGADAGGEVLTIHDVAGRRLRSLRLSELGTASWDGLTGDGRPVARGVYFYRLESRGSAPGQRLIVLE